MAVREVGAEGLEIAARTGRLFLEGIWMSLAMFWPILLAVGSEIVYQICAKSTPAAIDPLASLSVTYAVGAVASILLYLLLNRGGNLVREYAHINWSTIALGIAIVGLEAGAIYMYKVGWTVSTGPLVKNICVMVAMVLLGALAYHEVITPTKLAGIIICLIGVIIINK